MKKETKFIEIVNHLKSTGFVYQNSEIYDGLANTWDFGPLGSLLKENIKIEWKKHFIYNEENNHLIDSAIFSNPRIWEASGHVGNFHDPLIDCKKCKERYRADHILEEITKKSFDGMAMEELQKEFDKHKTFECPKCKSKEWTKIRTFELMFKVDQEITSDKSNYIYLRPETAQEIFVNFKNVLNSTRSKLPMGIGQIGKAFRNEISPGNFIFRSKEFEQMELEFFVSLEEEEKYFEYYLNSSLEFLKNIGLDNKKIIQKNIPKEELAHYSKKTIDINYIFPFGEKELMGIANRGNHDLTNHEIHSKNNLHYLDPITNKKYIPSVIEPSIGVERLMLAIMVESFEEESIGEDTRIVLKFKKNLAPYKACILPLQNKLDIEAKKIYKELIEKLNIPISYDKSGSIGKRYRRQDAIGTPSCITIDFETQIDKMVTIRDRDTMKQERIKISDIHKYI